MQFLVGRLYVILQFGLVNDNNNSVLHVKHINPISHQAFSLKQKKKTLMKKVQLQSIPEKRNSYK